VIHQIGSTLAYGDAITNHIVALDHQLSRWGLPSRIYGARIDGSRITKAELDTAFVDGNESDDILIYHYSAFCENYQLFRRSRNRKILIYHNITPASFYSPYDAGMAEVCSRGRELLPMLHDCDLALGVSEFNRQELVAIGFNATKTAVLPILLSLDNFATKARDEWVYQRLTKDGLINILVTGRIAPNKAYEEIIKIFAEYHHSINPHSRLHFVGTRFVRKYNELLDRLVSAFGLHDAITFTDRVSLAVLKAYYEASHVFVCASRHEGFCVPLVEAMSFGLPILARAGTAIPETLGSAGVLYQSEDYPVLAETLGLMVEDQDFRTSLAEGQRARLADFAPARVATGLRAALARVGLEVAQAA